jgi:addiction module toxin relE
MYKVRLTNQAKEHLMLIRNYYKDELKEPNVAYRLINLLKSKMMSLSKMTYRVKCVDEEPWRRYGLRKIIAKNYNIYFLIDDDKKIVNIVAIIYSRMNQDNQLKITMD